MARLVPILLLSLIFVITIANTSAKSASAPATKTDKVCPTVKCPGNKPKSCPYGYYKKDGCEICRCNDPCNPPDKPILCGSKQRCYVHKNANGGFEGRCGPPPEKSKGRKRVKIASDVCGLPKLTGPCRAAFPRFYYNSATESCEAFTYGGCHGNKNNFQSKSECEKACVA